jgi:hypothetical protein
LPIDQDIIDAVMRASDGVHPHDAANFIEAAVELLKGEPELGPGLIHRVLVGLLASGHFRRCNVVAAGSEKRRHGAARYKPRKSA